MSRKPPGKPAKPAAPPKERTWTKTHPLEGDGLLVNFYNYMWKKNKDFQSCPGVRCPDTIVYDHNFPRGWYTYDQKNKELKKKQGKELDTSSLLASFSRTPDASIDIVASYIYSFEQESGEAVTSVEFFTDKDLGEFLNNRKTKKEGILQKFMIPKGKNNSLIQAVWSPRVCIVQRKTNRHPLSDKSYSAYERAVTYEGPSHFTEDGICAPKTTAQIKNICSNICQHFQNTEHKNISRMVLYFKVDKNDQVWLLWCGSIRISDRQHQSQMPLNLSPIFTSPDQSSENQGGIDLESQELQDVDRHHYALSGDLVFKKTHCSPPHSPAKAKTGKLLDVKDENPDAQAASASTGGAAAGSATATGTTGASGDPTTGAASPTGDKPPEARPPVMDEWYVKDPHVHEQYKQIMEEKELVSQMFGDVFYEAYSHFLRHDSGGFLFTIPPAVKQLLGEANLDKLVSHLKLGPVPQDKIARLGRNISMDFGLDFWIPDAHHQPISKLGMECQTWIRKFFGQREHALKKQAKGHDAMEADAALLGVGGGHPDSDDSEND